MTETSTPHSSTPGVCWECGGPCRTYKGTVHGWRCAACCLRHVEAGAVRAATADVRERRKQMGRFFAARADQKAAR